MTEFAPPPPPPPPETVREIVQAAASGILINGMKMDKFFMPEFDMCFDVYHLFMPLLCKQAVEDFLPHTRLAIAQFHSHLKIEENKILHIVCHYIKFHSTYVCAKHLSTKFRPCPEVVKGISSSTQLSIKFFLLVNVKMPTIVTFFGILTFMIGKQHSRLIRA